MDGTSSGEVAPCTFSDRFHGRFRDVSEGKSPSELFSYVFTLRRAWKVLIEMRGGKDAGTVWLFIRWVSNQNPTISNHFLIQVGR
ncbi:MAG: hypothetical protein ACMVO3_01900 [Thalassobaculum sp.]